MDPLAQVVAWTSNPFHAHVQFVRSCPFAGFVVFFASVSAFAAARAPETDFDRQSSAPNCWAAQDQVAVVVLYP